MLILLDIASLADEIDYVIGYSGDCEEADEPVADSVTRLLSDKHQHQITTTFSNMLLGVRVGNEDLEGGYGDGDIDKYLIEEYIVPLMAHRVGATINDSYVYTNVHVTPNHVCVGVALDES